MKFNNCFNILPRKCDLKTANIWNHLNAYKSLKNCKVTINPSSRIVMITKVSLCIRKTIEKEVRRRLSIHGMTTAEAKKKKKPQKVKNLPVTYETNGASERAKRTSSPVVPTPTIISESVPPFCR